MRPQADRTSLSPVSLLVPRPVQVAAVADDPLAVPALPPGTEMLAAGSTAVYQCSVWVSAHDPFVRTGKALSHISGISWGNEWTCPGGGPREYLRKTLYCTYCGWTVAWWVFSVVYGWLACVVCSWCCFLTLGQFVFVRADTVVFSRCLDVVWRLSERWNWFVNLESLNKMSALQAPWKGVYILPRGLIHGLRDVSSVVKTIPLVT